jgi:mono/diheme cytochrome c family protein
MSVPRLRLGLGGLSAAAVALAFLTRPAGAPGQAQAEKRGAQDEQAAFFEKEVLPILKANCFKCHGNGKARGGLSLASRAGVLKGGDRGPAVSLTRPEESLLLKAIHYQGGLEMPPDGRLKPAEIATLTRWLQAGLPYPDSGPALVTPGPRGLRVTDADRQYWAYRAVRRPDPPAVKNRAWVRNPIDAFILAGLEARGLSPNPEAERRALARRVHYDLTGLPPAPEEIDAFVNDPAPDAYERLIDRLLASPRYGEKWARHWLDLVRYGETNGFEFDRAKPFVWRYRDYVIDAFNRDLPYDQFVREQLAGDQLAAVTPQTLTATGYYLLGQWDDGAADRVLQRYEALDSILSTTGQVFLGMSLGCARCHDHKKDPIPQKDYYRLLAFFHNLGDLTGRSTRRVQPQGPGPAINVLAVSERGSAPTYVLLRGNPRAQGERVEPGFPEVLVRSSAAPTPAPPPKGGGGVGVGGRLALANWLTDANNPLTARVLVNRLWQHHFGRGIVPTPNDFGKLGEPPTHPELLDWLASEFVAGGWQVKRMHRLLMTSSAYRMSVHGNERALRLDPANTLFWRFNLRRLTAEEVRDSMLAVSGKLNHKMGGPSIYPAIPREVLAGQSRPGAGWKTSPPDEAARRSVYIHVKRSLLVPLLAQFDLADTDSSCPVRFTTTVSTQALGLLNGEFSSEQAAAFARRLVREAPAGLEAQVRRAIRLTTGRVPAAAEVADDVAFVHRLRQTNRLGEEEALRFYCLMLLNANEFIYLE